MNNPFVKIAVRSMFVMTSRKRAARNAAEYLRKYMALAKQVTPETGKRPIKVPSLCGLDEDMREWSFFMILEHNTIVNRIITTRVCQLARGEPLTGGPVFDPKKDVMPSPNPGEEQVGFFQDSIAEHIASVNELDRLRGTNISPHPLFGKLDAHKWNCVFSYHLRLHLPQAEIVIRG